MSYGSVCRPAVRSDLTCQPDDSTASPNGYPFRTPVNGVKWIRACLRIAYAERSGRYLPIGENP